MTAVGALQDVPLSKDAMLHPTTPGGAALRLVRTELEEQRLLADAAAEREQTAVPRLHF